LFAAQPAGGAAVTASEQNFVPAGLGLRLSWLAPATALLVLLFALHSQRDVGDTGGATNSAPFVAMILSNQTVAYLPAGYQRERNGPPSDTFEWTNGSRSSSSIRSLSAPRAPN
jgi:hypothetical protein